MIFKKFSLVKIWQWFNVLDKNAVSISTLYSMLFIDYGQIVSDTLRLCDMLNILPRMSKAPENSFNLKDH